MTETLTLGLTPEQKAEVEALHLALENLCWIVAMDHPDLCTTIPIGWCCNLENGELKKHVEVKRVDQDDPNSLEVIGIRLAEKFDAVSDGTFKGKLLFALPDGSLLEGNLNGFVHAPSNDPAQSSAGIRYEELSKERAVCQYPLASILNAMSNAVVGIEQPEHRSANDEPTEADRARIIRVLAGLASIADPSTPQPLSPGALLN